MVVGLTRSKLLLDVFMLVNGAWVEIRAKNNTMAGNDARR
jgi:hypothetical protein